MFRNLGVAHYPNFRINQKKKNRIPESTFLETLTMYFMWNTRSLFKLWITGRNKGNAFCYKRLLCAWATSLHFCYLHLSFDILIKWLCHWIVSIITKKLFSTFTKGTIGQYRGSPGQSREVGRVALMFPSLPNQGLFQAIDK